MPSESSTVHPLAEVRATAALTLIGLCGVGWGIMIAQFVAPGLFLSALGALATLWLYFGDLKSAAVGIRDFRNVRSVPKPIIVAYAVILTEIVMPVWLYLEISAPINLMIVWAVVIFFLCILVFSYDRDRKDVPAQPGAGFWHPHSVLRMAA